MRDRLQIWLVARPGSRVFPGRLVDRGRSVRMGPSGLSRFGVASGLRGLVGLLVCLAELTVAASAAGASGWVVQSVPAPTLPAGQLTAVSCPSASWCMAVGSGPNGGFCRALGRRVVGGREPSRSVGRGAGGHLVLVADGLHGGRFDRCRDKEHGVGRALGRNPVGSSAGTTGVGGGRVVRWCLLPDQALLCGGGFEREPATVQGPGGALEGIEVGDQAYACQGCSRARA